MIRHFHFCCCSCFLAPMTRVRTESVARQAHSLLSHILVTRFMCRVIRVLNETVLEYVCLQSVQRLQRLPDEQTYAFLWRTFLLYPFGRESHTGSQTSGSFNINFVLPHSGQALSAVSLDNDDDAVSASALLTGEMFSKTADHNGACCPSPFRSAASAAMFVCVPS